MHKISWVITHNCILMDPQFQRSWLIKSDAWWFWSRWSAAHLWEILNAVSYILVLDATIIQNYLSLTSFKPSSCLAHVLVHVFVWTAPSLCLYFRGKWGSSILIIQLDLSSFFKIIQMSPSLWLPCREKKRLLSFMCLFILHCKFLGAKGSIG